MTTRLVILLSVLSLLSGCASKKPKQEAAFIPVPGPSSAPAIHPYPAPAAELEAAKASAAPKPAKKEPKPAKETKKAPKSEKPIVTTETGLKGRVISYNGAGRFVVLRFPLNKLPTLDQTMFLYRSGLKVGEVKITGPQRGDSIVADLVLGEGGPGDEVSDK